MPEINGFFVEDDFRIVDLDGNEEKIGTVEIEFEEETCEEDCPMDYYCYDEWN